MTAAVEASEYALKLPNFLLVILQQMGLQCEVVPSTAMLGGSSNTSSSNPFNFGSEKFSFASNGNGNGIFNNNNASANATPNSFNSTSVTSNNISAGAGAVGTNVGVQSQYVLKHITQIPLKDFPTLSAMRHVTFICGNIARFVLESQCIC